MINHAYNVPTVNKFGFVPNLVNIARSSNYQFNTAALMTDIWGMEFSKMDNFVKIDIFQNNEDLIVEERIFELWFHDTTNARICVPDPNTI